MRNKKTWYTAATVLILLLLLAYAGYQRLNNRYEKYSQGFFDTFDTLITVVGYTKSEAEFDSYFQEIHSRFQEMHRLFDIYNNYDGVNNIKTINDNAGKQPVKVKREIIDLILFAKDWYEKTGGKTNIAMGSVLRIWHDYREMGQGEPEKAQIPPMNQLREAAKHTDIDRVIVDPEAGTVFLPDPRMSLDVGAVAKGYATEIVAREAIASGFRSGLISSGGNVRVIGKPLDGVRERWGIGVQDPGKSIVPDEQNLLDTIFVQDGSSVASSGDYQRYYVVDGKVLHHIIDPETLMPAEYYRAVTVMAPHSGAADFLSTTVFLLPYDESRALVDSLEGVEAIWVFHDGRIEASEGMKAIMRSHGATGAKLQ